MIIFDTVSVFEVLSVLREIEKETLLLVIVYRITGPLGTLNKDFILINELEIQHRILIVDDFNLDQILPENVAPKLIL